MRDALRTVWSGVRAMFCGTEANITNGPLLSLRIRALKTTCAVQTEAGWFLSGPDSFAAVFLATGLRPWKRTLMCLIGWGWDEDTPLKWYPYVAHTVEGHYGLYVCGFFIEVWRAKAADRRLDGW